MGGACGDEHAARRGAGAGKPRERQSRSQKERPRQGPSGKAEACGKNGERGGKGRQDNLGPRRNGAGREKQGTERGTRRRRRGGMKKRDKAREVAEGLRRRESCGETRERFGGFPERPARRKRRGAGKEVAGARGGGVDGNPLLPRPVHGFCDAPATRFRRSSPARRSPFSRRLPLRPASPDVPQRDGRSPNVARKGLTFMPPLSAGAQAPASSPAPRSLLRFFHFYPLSPHFAPDSSAPPFPRRPARRFLSPRLPTKKRAEVPPRGCSCGPDAATVHRRIRTCIQNEARRASRP